MFSPRAAVGGSLGRGREVDSVIGETIESWVENIFAESIKGKSDLPPVSFFKLPCFRISGKREEESFFRARGRPAKVRLCSLESPL